MRKYEINENMRKMNMTKNEKLVSKTTEELIWAAASIRPRVTSKTETGLEAAFVD